jgi:acetyl-CoA acetyltransferase
MTGIHQPFLGRTAIAGVGYTQFSRDSGASVLQLATEACRNAIADSGLTSADVDGLGSFMVLNDSVPCQAVASMLGARDLSWCTDLNLGGQAPSYLILLAAIAIHAGVANTIVVFRALNGRSGVRVGSGEFSGPGGQYRYPVGFTAYAQYMAMWARRYMIETGAGHEDLGAVAVAQREYAIRNERAIERRPLSLEQYLEAPLIADPYRASDCTAEVDGACAVVLTSLERARALPHRPAVVRGARYVLGHRSGLDIGDALLWEDLSRNYTSLLADGLWSSAGTAPSDIDFAEIYDCFTSTVLFGLEGLGFVGRGEAGAYIRSGATGIDGSLPVNTNGGLLGEGYLHGMNTVAEAVLQIQGRCGDRQVRRHDACVVTSGGMMDGSALVLVAD